MLTFRALTPPYLPRNINVDRKSIVRDCRKFLRKFFWRITCTSCGCQSKAGTFTFKTAIFKLMFVDGFQSHDKTAVLVHKTIANDGSCFA